MYARWFLSDNWGDAVNPELIKFLSGRYPKYLSRKKLNLKNKFLPKPVYLVCGSILSWADKNSVVWGPGFISSGDILKIKPKKILAVRGYLSWKKIVNQGYDAPKIFGDPALLFPRFYNPNISKKFKLGIIPHFTDWNNSYITKYKTDPNVLIIDITAGIYNVVDKILSCEKIASSSLHGIILADAYDIPSTWIKLGDRIIGKGFKFLDYFSSVGRKDKTPLIITNETNMDDIIKRMCNKISIDLDDLIKVCPFKNV